MSRRILVINGHPDPSRQRFVAALCAAYAEGARAAGHQVRLIEVGRLALPTLRSAEDFIGGPVPPAAQGAQADIRWAEHLVVAHPLWLGSAPALLKGFFEQVFRYGFAVPAPGGKAFGGLLGGRSARVVVTMGMPAAIYRLGFGAFGVRGLERGILWLAGFSPIRRTLIGRVEADEDARKRWLQRVRDLGKRGA
ncbi:MAG TPA: NAD(P)H-dependent oxidoreductase [Caulobacteraceae bacterium]|jgi:putative NADPH-quinone reductase|nr:NAD(P)H-dependent oxidoreductase [Caulobacteraceae bacterium]